MTQYVICFVVECKRLSNSCSLGDFYPYRNLLFSVAVMAAYSYSFRLTCEKLQFRPSGVTKKLFALYGHSLVP